MQTTDTSMEHLILAGLIAGLVFAILAFRGQGFARFVLAVVALGLLLPSGLLFVARHPAIADPRFRTYQFLYWNLATGMSRDQVLSTVAEWYPPGQDPAAPRVVVDNGSTLELVMTPDQSGLPANERIVLKLDAGLVTGKDYQADR